MGRPRKINNEEFAGENPSVESPSADDTDTPKLETEKSSGEQEIEVGDPQILRPKELPLIVKGDWKNAEQIEYAKTLNQYAYVNPEKWKKKKDILIARLKELGNNPGKIVALRGMETNISYKSKKS